jgi:hypothetical protein
MSIAIGAVMVLIELTRVLVGSQCCKMSRRRRTIKSKILSILAAGMKISLKLISMMLTAVSDSCGWGKLTTRILFLKELEGQS